MIKHTLEVRLKQAAAVHGKGQIVFSYDDSLVTRLVHVWDADAINARSVRNFCLRFEQLAIAVVRQGGIASGGGAMQVQLRLRVRDDRLECVGDEGDVRASQLLPPVEDLGWTAVHRAVIHGGLVQLQQLGLFGADADAKDKRGRTPLHYAAEQHDADSISWLLQHGHADLTVADGDGFNALMIAVSSFDGASVQRSKATVRALLQEAKRRTKVNAAQRRLELEVVRDRELQRARDRKIVQESVEGPVPMEEDSSSESDEGDAYLKQEEEEDGQTALDQLLDQQESSGLRRTAVLLAWDVMAERGPQGSERAEWARDAVSTLVWHRFESTAHRRYVDAVQDNECDKAVGYPCDIDSAGRSLLPRMWSLLHQDPSKFPEHDIFSFLHPLPDGLPRGSDYEQLVSTRDLQEVCKIPCATCAEYVLHALKDSMLCLQCDTDTQDVLVHVLATVDLPLASSQMVAVFREAGVSIPWDHAKLSFATLQRLLSSDRAPMQALQQWTDSCSADRCGGCYDRPGGSVLAWFRTERLCATEEMGSILTLLQSIFDRWPSIGQLLFPDSNISRLQPWTQLHAALVAAWNVSLNGDDEDSQVIAELFRSALALMQKHLSLEHHDYWAAQLHFMLSGSQKEDDSEEPQGSSPDSEDARSVISKVSAWRIPQPVMIQSRLVVLIAYVRACVCVWIIRAQPSVWPIPSANTVLPDPTQRLLLRASARCG